MFTRIFSGFDVRQFINSRNDPGLRKKLGFGTDHFVIGKIARLFRLKGHADLLKAFAQIAARLPQARLLLVGDGVLRGELEQLAGFLGLRDKVVFAGLVPPDELAPHVGIMDCVAHLSYREAVSRAVPQALAAGKPVIAYDFDGAGEVCFQNENGFIVHTGDTGGVAQRLAQLAGDPALREQMGRRGRDFVAQNFTVEKMVKDQCSVYWKLAAQRGIRA